MRRWRVVASLALALVLALLGAATAKSSRQRLDPSHTHLPPSPRHKLAHAIVLTRHGDRTPVNPLPDESQHAKYWVRMLKPKLESEWHKRVRKEFGGKLLDRGDTPLGQLTQVGAHQMRSLGEYLRSVYVDMFGLLPEQATQDSLSSFPLAVYSTRYFRTAESAVQLLEGLYQPTHRTPDSLQLPIQFHSSSRETLLPRSSPARSRVAQEVHSLPNFGDVMEEAERLAEKVGEALGVGPATVSLSRVHEALQCRIAHNLPIPVHPKLAAEVTAHNHKLSAAYFSHPEYAAVTVGPLVLEIADVWASTVRAGNDGGGGGGGGGQAPGVANVVLFSGHDLTLTNLLHSLGAEHAWPRYASALELLLWGPVGHDTPACDEVTGTCAAPAPAPGATTGECTEGGKECGASRDEGAAGQWVITGVFNGERVVFGNCGDDGDVCTWEAFRAIADSMRGAGAS